MGQALLRLAAENPSLQIVAAVTRRSPAQRVVDGVPHFASSELAGAPTFDAQRQDRVEAFGQAEVDGHVEGGRTSQFAAGEMRYTVHHPWRR